LHVEGRGEAKEEKNTDIMGISIVRVHRRNDCEWVSGENVSKIEA